MSEQMDFEDGKYTVIYDEGHFKALRYGQPWRDLTGDNLVYAMLVKAIQLKEERDALAAQIKELEARNSILDDVLHEANKEVERLSARFEVCPEGGPDGIECRDSTIKLQDARIAELEAQLKELEGQEPVAWVGHGPRDGRVEFSISKPVPSVFRDFGFKPLFARPVPAEPVNARLLSLAKKFEDYMHGPTAWSKAQENALSAEIYDALAAAKAQQAEPVRLTRESVARAIWSVRREHEDRCDLELEDMGDSHPVWDEADAVLAVTELAQSKPALMTIEQVRDSERYAYLRSQHEGSVAASFAVFAPEQPIGEFGPVGSMPGELDAAIDAAIRANGYKVED